MATKRPKFPEIRAWVLCNNFNQRTIRIQSELQKEADFRRPLQFVTWNQTSRRLYRYFFYKVNEVPSPGRARGIASPWGLRIQALIRELRRRNGDYRRRWQRRIFQILELWQKTTGAPANKRNPAWQTCAQILTSANHWRRRSNASEKSQTWTNALWRAVHLNKRTRRVTQSGVWQTVYRTIAANRFRRRIHGWRSTATRLGTKWYG